MGSTPAPSRPFEGFSPRGGPSLRTGHLLIFLLATHTPLTLLWGAVPETYRVGQVEATPLVFAFSGVVLLGFVFGYSGLAKRLRHPGGLYVQVAHGLGRPVGVGAAATLLVAYIGLVAGLYGFFGGVLRALMQSVFGLSVPLWVGIALCVAAGAVLSRFRARQVLPIFAVILAIQLVTVVVTLVAAFRSPAGGVASYSSLEPGGLLTGTFGVALVFALMASTGTETAANYTAELRDPGRSLPRATYLSYAITSGVTVTGALAISVLVGPVNATAMAQQAGPALFPLLVAQVVGPGDAVLVTNALMAVLLTGVFGATAGLQGALVRQLAGLARDGVLPPRLITPNARGNRPFLLHFAHPVVGGLVALLIGDHTTGALEPWVLIGCTLGLVTTLGLASLSATVWFLRGEADEAGFFGWEGQVVAAAFSALTLGLVVMYGVTHVPSLNPEGSGGTWAVVAVIVVPFVVGVVWALILKEARPSAYATIGRSGIAPSMSARVPGPVPTAVSSVSVTFEAGPGAFERYQDRSTHPASVGNVPLDPRVGAVGAERPTVTPTYAQPEYAPLPPGPQPYPSGAHAAQSQPALGDGVQPYAGQLYAGQLYAGQSYAGQSYAAQSHGASEAGVPGDVASEHGAVGFVAPGHGAQTMGAPERASRRHAAPEPEVPGFGVPGFGVPEPGAPELGAPGFGVPGFGVPGFGVPEPGAPELGAPRFGVPGFGVPGFGVPEPGVPEPGAPGFGVPERGAADGAGQPALPRRGIPRQRSAPEEQYNWWEPQNQPPAR